MKPKTKISLAMLSLVGYIVILFIFKEIIQKNFSDNECFLFLIPFVIGVGFVFYFTVDPFFKSWENDLKERRKNLDKRKGE